MKVLVLAVAVLLNGSSIYAGTSGEFRGTIVAGPEHSDAWVYVLGRNHSIRRVYVSGARVRYDQDAPQAIRKNPIPKSLPVGTLVRVTAEQDAAGEWRATEIEILGSESVPEKKAPSPPTSQS